LLNIIFLRIILLNITVKTKYENLHQRVADSLPEIAGMRGSLARPVSQTSGTRQLQRAARSNITTASIF
jgi:hypothetical protein